MVSKELVKSIDVAAEYRKKTTLAGVGFYEKIEVYGNRVVGYKNNAVAMTWYFKDFKGIEVVHANINSQFGQIVFLTGINSQSRAIGLDIFGTQNQNAVNDTNRILFCGGMFSFGKTNDYTDEIAKVIRTAYDEYKIHEDDDVPSNNGGLSVADEIKKFKDLLDQGIITQEEFDAKKKQLLGL